MFIFICNDNFYTSLKRNKGFIREDIKAYCWNRHNSLIFWFFQISNIIITIMCKINKCFLCLQYTFRTTSRTRSKYYIKQVIQSINIFNVLIWKRIYIVIIQINCYLMFKINFAFKFFISKQYRGRTTRKHIINSIFRETWINWNISSTRFHNCKYSNNHLQRTINHNTY